MPAGELVLTSTTDSPAEVAAALGLPPPELVTPPVEPPVTPPAAPAKPAAVAKPAAAAPAAPVTTPAADEDDEAAEAGTALAGRKQKLQARINQLVREKSTTQSERDQVRLELARAEGELKALKAGTAAPPVVAAPPAPKADSPEALAAALAALGPKPKEADFDGKYDDYLDAREAWNSKKVRIEVEAAMRAEFEQKLEADRQARAAVENERIARGRLQEFEDRKTKAREVHADFDDAIAASKDLPVSQPMVDQFHHSEHGPDLMYYFATHPDEAQRLVKLPPGLALVELGKLEAKIEAGTLFKNGTAPVTPPADTPPARRVAVSGAPPPMPTVAGGSAVAVQKSPETMSHAEYKIWRKTHK